MEISSHQTKDGFNLICAKFLPTLEHDMIRFIFKEIATKIAERYVEEHYQEIVKLLDQQAITTLSAAEAAAAIRETLEKKLPDKILHIVEERTKTRVFQRGLLGGLREI